MIGITQKQNASFGSYSSVAKAAKQSANIVGKHTLGAITITGVMVADIITVPVILPLDIFTRTVSGASKLLKNLGLIKNSLNTRQYSKAIIKKHGAQIVKFYENMGLTTPAKVLGTKLW